MAEESSARERVSKCEDKAAAVRGCSVGRKCVISGRGRVVVERYLERSWERRTGGGVGLLLVVRAFSASEWAYSVQVVVRLGERDGDMTWDESISSSDVSGKVFSVLIREEISPGVKRVSRN